MFTIFILLFISNTSQIIHERCDRHPHPGLCAVWVHDMRQCDRKLSTVTYSTDVLRCLGWCDTGHVTGPCVQSQWMVHPGLCAVWVQDMRHCDRKLPTVQLNSDWPYCCMRCLSGCDMRNVTGTFTLAVFFPFFQILPKWNRPKNSLVHPEYIPRSRWGFASSPTGNSQVYNTLQGTFIFIQTVTDPTAVWGVSVDVTREMWPALAPCTVCCITTSVGHETLWQEAAYSHL